MAIYQENNILFTNVPISKKQMNMKRLFTMIVALAAIIAYASAQTLSVQPIEIQEGGQTEMVVNLTGGTSATALQFNLKLPDGMTVNTDGVSLGTATDGHTLSVQTLNSGDLLFILYSMDLKPFKDGELLRIPVTAGSTETTSNGKLYTVRTATADAVSHTCEDATFSAIVSGAYKLGDANGDGSVSVTDVTMVISHILGKTPEGFNAAVADVNGDGSISVTDVTMIINIILKGEVPQETVYYWYAGQTQPSSISGTPTVDDTNFTNNKWHTLGSTGSTSTTISKTVTGGTSGNYWYIAAPNGFIVTASDLITPDTSMTQLSNITINGVTYVVFKSNSTSVKASIYMAKK